ncbi:MAG: type II toxin-antitoxin system RelB family antitoxin [Sphingorhabdus sp.]
MAKLDPIVSEFATEEEAEAHDRWFRAQVQAALDEKDEPCIPHEEVMVRARAIIEKSVEKRKRANPDLAA